MRLVVLTTETLHHAYFVRELGETHPIAMVICETRQAVPPFETHHPFEDERDDHEREVWFNGKPLSLADLAETVTVESANDRKAVGLLRKVGPDVVVVFGTGRLSPDVIAICPDGVVNLHGGDPEEYRGLDTHLWAIYHHDYGGLVTTLHRLNSEIDAGDIIGKLPIPLAPDTRLCQLRRRNTEVCVRLVREALAAYHTDGKFDSRPQAKAGRYYSFMPTVLKELCRVRFEKRMSQCR